MTKIIHGDCLKVMNTIDKQSIDLILCDLPYGSTNCKWDIIIPFSLLWRHYERIIKNNGAILLFGMEPFSSHLRLSNKKLYRYDWYWNKKRGANFLFMNKQPGKIIETISVFYKHQPTYNPQKRINPHSNCKQNAKIISSNVRNLSNTNLESWQPSDNWESNKLLPTTLLIFVKDIKRIHPTQKPITLLEYLIKTYTNKGNLVLDNCAGSGSTGVACQNLDRDYILIEQDEKYFKIIQERLHET